MISSGLNYLQLFFKKIWLFLNNVLFLYILNFYTKYLSVKYFYKILYFEHFSYFYGFYQNFQQYQESTTETTTATTSSQQSTEKLSERLSCVSPATQNWENQVEPLYKTNPSRFILPALIWGPMNQVEGFRETIALAIALNRKESENNISAKAHLKRHF